MDQAIKQAIDIIAQALPEVIAIYLFGSSGTAFENKESDVDLAILSNETIPAVFLWELSQKIAVALGKDVDLINLQEASTVFCFQIISTGKRIYCRDKNKCDEFEMLSYSMYLRLNEERKDILNDIKRRGQIFNG